MKSSGVDERVGCRTKCDYDRANDCCGNEQHRQQQKSAAQEHRVGVLAEIGDLSRFQNPRELMGYLGLVPSESSTGDKVKRGGITKAGNGRARRILVDA
jgi:transposase